MNDPVLYAKSSDFQKQNGKKVLREFSHLFRFREDGNDSMLDIGCGTGEVTIESILPLLPANFNRLLGCDSSDEMIDFAQKFSGHPNVSYHKLDISGDVDDFLTKSGPFDHAISLFCLHWVRNQNAAMQNISKLLTDTGDCLLLFITRSAIFTVYYEMSKSSKWSQYMQDVERFISPYYDSVCPADDCSVTLQTAGFSTHDIRTRELTYLYENSDDFAAFIRSINPFVNRIPAIEQQDFVSEVARRTMAKNKEKSGLECLDEAEILIVYAKK